MPPEPAATDSTTPVPPFVDRRREPRFQVPPCVTCASSNTHVAARTPYFLYIRCRSCCEVWSVPMEGHDRALR
jgi:hypothetical protein